MNRQAFFDMDPPAGFEARVLRRAQPILAEARGRMRRQWLAKWWGGAGALVTASLLGWFTWRRVSPPEDLDLMMVLSEDTGVEMDLMAELPLDSDFETLMEDLDLLEGDEEG